MEFKGQIDDVDYNASDGKSFKYKTKIIGNRPAQPPWPGNPWYADQPPQPAVPSLNVEVPIPLRYLGNFWRSLNLPLMKSEVRSKW